MLFLLFFAGLLPMAATDVRDGDLRLANDAGSKTHFALPFPRSLSAWEERKGELRRQVLVAAGLWPLEADRSAVQARRELSRDFGTYSVERVRLETLPGFFVGANLYLPKNSGAGTGTHPAVLVAHGHWKHGRVHHADDYSVPALCANLAAKGYVAIAWDMVGYNDTRQVAHEFGDYPEAHDWSFHPMGLQLWNSIRVLDFVAALPQVDPKRIGMTGASGGATQTILLTAVDDRIAVSAPVVMVSTNFQGDDDCERAPGLRVGTSNVEIAAIMAPRPMLLVSASGDWTKQTPSAEFPAIRSVYALYANTDAVRSAHFDTGHNYNRSSRQAVYEFFGKHLFGSNAAVIDEPATLPARADLLWPAGNLPEDEAAVLEAWKSRAREANSGLDPQAARERLQAVLGVEWPRSVDAMLIGDRLVLQRAGSGDRVPAVWQPGQSKSVTVVVDAGGIDAARKHSRIRELAAWGEGFLFVRPFRTGSGAGSSPRHNLEYLTFHLSDDANRVQDIVTALAYVESQSVRLICPGRAGAWCVVAAAVSPKAVTVERDATSGVNERLNLPGVELAGGMETAQRLTNRVVLAGQQ